MPIQAGKAVSFLNPQTITETFDLKPGMKVADFGSGAGYFALPAAQKVGEKGVVTAIDVNPQVLEVLRGHIVLEGVLRVTTVQANLERAGASGLPDASQDRVLCTNILHQTGDPASVIKEARRVLKPSGQLVVIDWYEDVPLGPKQTIARQEVEHLAQAEGFILKKQLEAGAFHYGLLFSLQD